MTEQWREPKNAALVIVGVQNDFFLGGNLTRSIAIPLGDQGNTTETEMLSQLSDANVVVTQSSRLQSVLRPK